MCQGVDYTYMYTVKYASFWSFACLLVKGSILESTPDVQTADLVLIFD